MELEDIEKIVLADVAKKVIETLPEEERRQILEASLTKTLSEIMKPWNVERAIKDDVNRYMAEYIKQPEVQERIKLATQKAVDRLTDGVINAIIVASQDAIKSQYKEFINKEEEK